MRYFLVVLSICLVVTSVTAQQTIGFRDPGNIQPVLNYRLPDWKTTITSLGLNVMANGYDEELSNEKISGIYNYFSIYPRSNYFRESENLIYRNDIGLDFQLNYSKRILEFDKINLDDWEDKDQRYQIEFNTDNEFYRYLNPTTFFTNRVNVSIYYQEINNESKRKQAPKPANKQSYYNRIYSGEIQLGIGRGKVRNVTPIFKALRFRERARALNLDYFSSPEELQKLAHMAAKLESYYQVYDRAGKYFWKQFYDRFDYLDSLSPYEHYYLADAMSETYGARFEGKKLLPG